MSYYTAFVALKQSYLLRTLTPLLKQILNFFLDIIAYIVQYISKFMLFLKKLLTNHAC